jgi:hypothetical protein
VKDQIVSRYSCTIQLEMVNSMAAGARFEHLTQTDVNWQAQIYKRVRAALARRLTNVIAVIAVMHSCHRAIQKAK